ncbi:helix-turn-helix domain-containing protein [Actinophytocola sp.]|uniref:helix-turn-helix domain-containing protein n=1 Tax=Actinophytocola sp. TaxID=1872138 RepID=UPI002ED59F09
MIDQAMAGEIDTRFGALLRRFRTDYGLTQRMLADLSTISERAIRDLEQGKAQPRAGTVRLIAEALRLGRQARTSLERAANGGRARLGLDAELATPPTVLDTMVGRAVEAAALTAELADGASRLITISGLPGVGKTRLAIEIAHSLQATTGMPVPWLGATDSPVRDRRLAGLLHGCSAALYGRAGTADLAELTSLIADRDALLVLDGDRPRAEPLLHMLAECPRLRVLITATRPGGIVGERLFLLNPLATPDPDLVEPRLLEDVPSVRLFLDHVHRARPGYELTRADAPVVAEICELVDGLPPALISAAAWLAVYDLVPLCRMLRADPAAVVGNALLAQLAERVRTLPVAAHRALATLSELGTDFTIDDVVTSTGRSVADAGLLLRQLLQHGVIRVRQADGQSRFQVLALIRALP